MRNINCMSKGSTMVKGSIYSDNNMYIRVPMNGLTLKLTRFEQFVQALAEMEKYLTSEHYVVNLYTARAPRGDCRIP